MCKVLSSRISKSVDYSHTHSTTRFFIIDNGMHYCIWPNGQISCFCGPRKRRSIGAEISAKRTTSLTKSSSQTLTSPLLTMYVFGYSEMRTTPNNYISIFIIGHDALLH